MVDDSNAIKSAAQTYLDGLYVGDADKLATVFHPTSALTWEQDGALKLLPRDEWLKAVQVSRLFARWTASTRFG